jgi:hypothetical protein
MTSFPTGRDERELTPSRAGAKTPYEFLVSHAKVIERLVPDERAVAFFDARRKPLRGRGPVPLSETGPQVRAVTRVVWARKTGFAWPSVSGER